MKWEYEETPLNGGAPGNAFQSIFNGSGKKPAETLAREAIQNSVDAATEPNATVQVDFRFSVLEGSARRAFEDAAALSEMSKRASGLGLMHGNALEVTDGPLKLLYIDDYGTTGLKGDPTSPSSNLRKLLMDLGGSDKAQMAESSGGSYGFGKAVYSASSRLGTIFAYSETKNEDGEAISLLMGCAYQQGHVYEDTPYTGRAWFGVSTEVPDKGIRFDPFEGDQARELAIKLGIRREGNAMGTSILVIDAGVDQSHLLAGIEDWWWPRIQQRLLDASVLTPDGDELSPRPGKRQHLKPFLNAFDSAVGKTPDIPGKIMRRRFNATADKDLGHLGAIVLDDSADENPLGEDFEARLNTVALIRGPLMVVDYYSNWSPPASAPPSVGCFIADDDVDFLLKLSEPPDHSRWDAGADRLVKRGGTATEVVGSLLRRIKTQFRKFQNDAKPPAPPRPRRLAKLERDLASWFGVGPKGTGAGTGPNATPISLVTKGPKLSLEDGMLCARGSVEIKLTDKEEAERWFRLRLTLQVAEEDGVSSTDPVELVWTSDTPLEDLQDGFLLGKAEQGQTILVEYVSAPYDAGWTLRFLPEVLPIKEELQP